MVLIGFNKPVNLALIYCFELSVLSILHFWLLVLHKKQSALAETYPKREIRRMSFSVLLVLSTD